MAKAKMRRKKVKESTATLKNIIVRVPPTPIVAELAEDRYNEDNLTDLDLLCKDGKLRVHRLILMAASTFLFDLYLTQDMNLTPALSLPDISVRHMGQIMDLLYHGTITLGDEDLEAVSGGMVMLGLPVEGMHVRRATEEDLMRVAEIPSLTSTSSRPGEGIEENARISPAATTGQDEDKQQLPMAAEVTVATGPLPQGQKRSSTVQSKGEDDDDLHPTKKLRTNEGVCHETCSGIVIEEIPRDSSAAPPPPCSPKRPLPVEQNDVGAGAPQPRAMVNGSQSQLTAAVAGQPRAPAVAGAPQGHKYTGPAPLNPTQLAQPDTAHVQGQEFLSASALAVAQPNDQRQILGELLIPLVGAKLSDSLLLPQVPYLHPKTKEDLHSPQLREFCVRHPVTVLRGFRAALDLKIHSLSTSPLVTPAFDPTRANVENISKYVKAQLHELVELPDFLRVISKDNILSHAGPGNRTVQLSYLNLDHCRSLGQPGFPAVSINIGPGDCKWSVVAEPYFEAISKLCKRKQCRFACLKDLNEAGIPVYRFTQKPGDLVWVGGDSFHWTQALGEVTNIHWNTGPCSASQFRLATERSEWNLRRRVKNFVPMVSLAWNLAKEKGLLGLRGDLELIELLKKTLSKSLRQSVNLLNFAKANNIPVRFRERSSKDLILYCRRCNVETFNIRFVRKDEKKDIYCVDCAKKTSPNMNEDFICVEQFKLNSLLEVYENLSNPIVSNSKENSFASTGGMPVRNEALSLYPYLHIRHREIIRLESAHFPND